MRIKFLVTATCMFLAVCLQAQTRALSQAGRFYTHLPTTAQNTISHTLARRVENTYLRLFWNKHLSSELLPGQKLSQPFTSRPKDIYPDVPFLTKQEDLELYFIAKNNREMQKLLTSMQRQTETLRQNAQSFCSACQQITLSPEQIPSWLVAQIPEKTEYLLLGEQHGFAQIKQTVSQLLGELRQRFPNRPMMLFTEFLPEHHLWGATEAPTSHKSFFPVWEQAQEAHIPVIGLEPLFVAADHALCLNSPLRQEQQRIWASPEGLRIRNNRWIQTLTQYRTKYPQALFIVYAGTGHLLYADPHTLGKQLANFNTQVFTFHPANDLSYFDILTSGIFTNQPILYITDEKSAHTAGFDIQIKIDEPATPAPGQ